MKNRFWLFQRHGVFYLQDSQTRRKESLHTRDRGEAERLRTAHNDAAQNPALGMALAKAYLSAHDPEITKRTWQMVMNHFCTRGQPQTQAHRKLVTQRRGFNLIRSKKLLETTADDFLAILEGTGMMVHVYLRCLHNLALGLNWLPWPVLPDKLWPVRRPKPRRGITAAEHQRIIAAEQNIELRYYYELLWEIGASQSDAAALLAENIQWETRVLSYQRKKTGVWCYIRIGQRLEKLLRQLPDQGVLFPHVGDCTCSVRASEFSRRCHQLDIQGVSLHSYRYAWAERAKTCGYPERFAQEALGHNSKAVHRAYAKKSKVILPPLEEYEGKILPELPLMTNQTQPEFCSELHFKSWQPASIES